MPDLHLVTAQEAATLLGITAARVRQLADEGRIPPATALGPRASVWLRADIERYAHTLRGDRHTGVAGLMATATAPMPRIYDGILSYADATGTARQIHVRAWHTDNQPPVVLVGSPSDEVDLVIAHAALIAHTVSTEILSGNGGEAAWFRYAPAGDTLSDGEHVVENLVFTLTQPAAPAEPGGRLRFLRGRSNDPVEDPTSSRTGPFGRLVFRPSSLHDLERITGSPVEAYPALAYTTATILQHVRSRQLVDVVDDHYGELPLIRALTVLQGIASSHPHYRTARDAAPALAREITERADVRTSQPWSDGLTPEYPSEGAPWPTAFAARHVQIPSVDTVRDAALAQESIDEQWPWDRVRIDQEWDLLRRTRAWLEDVDEYSSAPDPDCAEALKKTLAVVTHWIRIADPDAMATDVYPAAKAISFRIAGPHDYDYLDAVAWQPQITRGARQLRRSISHPDVRYGADQDGNPVAHSPSSREFAVLWPLTVPTTAYPPGSRIVADGDTGPRPVYVYTPDSVLHPLPALPQRTSQWNFGYSGGAVALAPAIDRAIATMDGIDESALPHQWLRDQLEHSEGSLDISIDELRKRI